MHFIFGQLAETSTVYEHIETQTDRQTDRQTGGRWAGGQAGRQAGRKLTFKELDKSANTRQNTSILTCLALHTAFTIHVHFVCAGQLRARNIPAGICKEQTNST